MVTRLCAQESPPFLISPPSSSLLLLLEDPCFLPGSSGMQNPEVITLPLRPPGLPDPPGGFLTPPPRERPRRYGPGGLRPWRAPAGVEVPGRGVEDQDLPPHWYCPRRGLAPPHWYQWRRARGGRLLVWVEDGYPQPQT